jgi:oligopeptide/dipeptide ABC transporter ATP-binding protein
MGEILQVEKLQKHFVSTTGAPWNRKTRTVRAVDGVDFSLGEGEVVGLVGESGCGKSTVASLLMRILSPTGGLIRYRGEDITESNDEVLRKVRRRMQMVFQDPFASLDPMMTLNEIITEPFDIFGLLTANERLERAASLLSEVGLSPEYGTRYPHELSGGQRQRVAVARALAPKPDVIIADEPTSALDVSVKAQIINLLEEIQARTGLAMLFISHDLSVVHHISTRVMVMYLGKIVETAPTAELFNDPRHPYTKVLLDAIPIADPRRRRRRRTIVKGEAVLESHTGCRFFNRCTLRSDICREKEPTLETAASGHLVSCFNADKED